MDLNDNCKRIWAKPLDELASPIEEIHYPEEEEKSFYHRYSDFIEKIF